MPAMTKRVNINAKVAIRDVKPPIYGTLNNVVMTTGNILKCLCKRAIVEEILPDGSTVRLTMKNYYTDNGAGLTAAPDPTKKKKSTKPQKTGIKVEKETPKEPEAVKEEVVETVKEPEIEATTEETKVPTPVETEEKINEEDKSNVDIARQEEKNSEEVNDSSDEAAGEGSAAPTGSKKTNSRKRR